MASVVASSEPGGLRWQLRASLADLAAVVLFTVAVFVASVRWEWHEVFSRWVSGYERWEADELPLTFLALAVGLSWFALRRARKAQLQIAERLRAEQRVGELLAANRELAQQLILAQENERRALARELHDELGQTCTAIRAEAAFIVKANPEDRAAVASARRIATAAEGLYELVRDMLRRLRPAALDSLGLVAALQELCESWEEQSGIPCRFFPEDSDVDPSDAIGMTVYRLVQEGLSNVLRHAQASEVKVALGIAVGDAAGSKCIALRIEDDGRGMSDPEGAHVGLGMLGMRERVAALHGRIEVTSSPGRGLLIEVLLPLVATRP